MQVDKDLELCAVEVTAVMVTTSEEDSNMAEYDDDVAYKGSDEQGIGGLPYF